MGSTLINSFYPSNLPSSIHYTYEDHMKIVIAQHKGGVGKTTLATHVTGILADEGDEKVLLIDCDSQGDSFKFITSYPPNSRNELATGKDDVDVIWNPQREGLAKRGAYNEYDHVVVDIDTRITNSLQVISELSPDAILIPVDNQRLSVQHAKETASLIAEAEGIMSYPAAVKVIQMGSSHDLSSTFDDVKDLPKSLNTNNKLPFLQKEFDDALNEGEYIWEDNTYEDIQGNVEEIIYGK